MGFPFLFILNGTPTSAALNGAVTLMRDALESWLRLRSNFLRFFVGGDVEIFQLCCSIPLLVTAISRPCWGHAMELYNCRSRMAARCPRIHSSPDGLSLT